MKPPDTPPLPPSGTEENRDPNSARSRSDLRKTLLQMWILLGTLGVIFWLVLLFAPGIGIWWVDTSKTAAAKNQMTDLWAAISEFRLQYKRLPHSLDELAEPVEGDLPPILAEVPIDPWGRQYDYRVVDPMTYQLRSKGEDGISDTDDDIVNR